MGTKDRMAIGRLPRPLGAPNVPSGFNQTQQEGHNDADPKEVRMHKEPTRIGIRVLNEGHGGV